MILLAKNEEMDLVKKEVILQVIFYYPHDESSSPKNT